MTDERTLAEQQLTTGVILLGRHYPRQFDTVVEEFGLSGASAFPLAMLGRMEDGTRQGDLARALGVEGPALVRQLDRLCALGLVERVEDAVDRRAKKLHLTIEGRRVASIVEAQFTRLRRRLLAGVSNEDIAAALRIFHILEIRMGDPSDIDQPEG
ncbi:MarR family transcriptional regulator [Sphingobium sp. C100]|uniref:MarR family winged helix-turn-helix transcriptional regulator n=1 Tax=Sphingobium sp. C100 TaxID=1207055 RepID=UPI0003D693C3|nr:MarR family transcriptional regulator [Sphingobium sp. C100]ETI64556.1 MarR family transcriptional regulator [Sphingobium sp. C100]